MLPGLQSPLLSGIFHPFGDHDGVKVAQAGTS
jgi:hypothetical protein